MTLLKALSAFWHVGGVRQSSILTRRNDARAQCMASVLASPTAESSEIELAGFAAKECYRRTKPAD
jgi:hypothetical protein